MNVFINEAFRLINSFDLYPIDTLRLQYAKKVFGGSIIKTVTLAPIRVTVESMFSTPGGTLQFTDVLPTDRDWANLSVADSKEFIALGLRIPSVMEWNPGFNENTYYAFDMTMVEFGTLNHGCMGVLTLVANHGLAFDQAYTSKHSLFFMFNLV